MRVHDGVVHPKVVSAVQHTHAVETFLDRLTTARLRQIVMALEDAGDCVELSADQEDEDHDTRLREAFNEKVETLRDELLMLVAPLDDPEDAEP